MDSVTIQPTSTLPHYLHGSVTLVGAGPGDPELLTVKALNSILDADVILYDFLVSPEIVALFPKQSHAIAVGKRCNRQSTSQQTINELLLQYAQLGKKVCRLKGGDPFIFGRGGEEALFLEHHNIQCAIIPGITAAMGCCSYSGIPLTHRQVSRGFTVITAHSQKDTHQINWQALVELQHSLVFYMGLNRAEQIAAQLMRHGMAASTPIAIISQGTTPNQSQLITSLAQLPEQLAKHTLPSPALIVIGDVVTYHHQIHNTLLRDIEYYL
ncbi:uroporphyrinogen-III C-methyltransferase [Photobacterium leiognathi]|uniref:uroporphyrinogen-III C-methyltransferase n=1 Tax=Photobacterium leiognathi TaxID=553611 RepID=UPI00273266F7|nr:uroporphyrinogen-III C-methyltransferase [Photobacterium leiognathi]